MDERDEQETVIFMRGKEKKKRIPLNVTESAFAGIAEYANKLSISPTEAAGQMIEISLRILASKGKIAWPRYYVPETNSFTQDDPHLKPRASKKKSTDRK